MNADTERWQCGICDQVMLYTQLLWAPNPFDPEDSILGCPHCRSVNDFQRLCDAPDCMKRQTCGWPSPDGYRMTCGDHAQLDRVDAIMIRRPNG